MESLIGDLSAAGLKDKADNALDVLVAVSTTYGLRVLGAIAILVVGYTISRVVFGSIARACKRHPRLDPTVANFFAQVARYAIMVVTIIAMLTTFGVATTSLVAALGALGLAIGLAVQGTLSNFAAGLMLIIFRPFRVGEYIEASGIGGNVQLISLFVTELDTLDNLRLVVPNGKLWGEIIKNFNRHETRRIDIRLRISYGDDIRAAMHAVEQVLAKEARILAVPKRLVAVEGLADNAVILLAQVWVNTADYWETLYALNLAFKRLFEDGEISQAIPHRVVHEVPAQGNGRASERDRPRAGAGRQL
jgi:small conductance mechanosensitive channel